jgi:signal transduction histidine kinase
VGRSGKEILRTNLSGSVPKNELRDHSREPYLYLALEGGAGFSTIFLSPEFEPHSRLSVPVRHGGKVEQVLVADLNLMPVVRAVRDLKIGGHIYIVDRNGVQIVHPDIAEILRGSNFLHRSIVQKVTVEGRLAKGLLPEDEYINERGESTFTVGKLISTPRLGIFFEQPRSQALAGERQAILIAVMTVVLGILIFIFFIRNNIRLTALNVKLRDLLRELDGVGKMLVRRDIELTRANTRLEALDRAKSEFVSVAAHQLRTPLTGIKWAMSLLLEEPQKLAFDQKKVIEDAFNATKRLTNLINDLLNVARMEEGHFGFHMKTQPLALLLKEISDMFAPALADKGITYNLDIPAQIPLLSFDHDKMGMAIGNLVDNAIKYTPAGGKVSLKVFPEVLRVVISISDSGIGIPKEQLNRVFSKFFRSANAQLYRTDGTGLGLYVAKNIITQHGGTMWFESAEDKGSTFYFSLPLPAGS